MKVRAGRALAMAWAQLGGRPLVRAVLPCGTFLLDMRSRTEAELLWNGEFDADEVAFMRAATPTGGTFVDVGANVGMVVVQMIQTSGLGRAVAIEPVPVNFDRLQTSVAWTASDAVCECVNVAVGAAPGHLELVKDHADGVSGNAVAALDGELGIRVPVTTLDLLVDELGLSRLDMLKIDVEGFEAEVFAGAAETVRRFRPVVYGEFHGEFMPLRGASFLDVWKVFADLDYVACSFRDALALVVHEQPLPTLGNAALIPRERCNDFRRAGYVFV